MTAALAGHARIAEALLAAGADTNLADHRGTTALMEAARSGAVGVVHALGKRKANAEPRRCRRTQRADRRLPVAQRERRNRARAARARRRSRTRGGRRQARARSRRRLGPLAHRRAARSGVSAAEHADERHRHRAKPPTPITCSTRFASATGTSSPSSRTSCANGRRRRSPIFISRSPSCRPAKRATGCSITASAAKRKLGDGRRSPTRCSICCRSARRARRSRRARRTESAAPAFLARLLAVDAARRQPALPMRALAHAVHRARRRLVRHDARRNAPRCTAPSRSATSRSRALCSRAAPIRTRATRSAARRCISRSSSTSHIAVPLLQALIKAGASPEIAAASGETPLGLALARSEHEPAYWLNWSRWKLPHRPLRAVGSCRPPRRSATSKPSSACSRFGFPLDAEDAQGATALIRAAGAGYAGLVVRLLEAGAESDARRTLRHPLPRAPPSARAAKPSFARC